MKDATMSGSGSCGYGSGPPPSLGGTAKMHEDKMAAADSKKAADHAAHLGRLGIDKSGKKPGAYSDPDQDN